MDKATYSAFLANWGQVMFVLGGISLIASILIRIIHSVKVGSIKDYKKKYDYLSTKESKWHLYSVLTFAVAIFLVINAIQDSTVVQSVWWFLIRMFIAMCISTLFGYVGYLLLKFYYPGKLQKKLDKYRYMPRISSAGNDMQLLSEDEEDVYLDEGMQAEENIFSIDYDVWVDNETKEIKIEKYPGHLEVLKCGTCSFQTLKLDHEEILQPATENEEGELLKHYECTYCNSKRVTKHKIAKLIRSDGEFKLPEDYVLKGERKIKSIMVEIISNKGEKLEYFFQNKEEASRFLTEFDFDVEPE